MNPNIDFVVLSFSLEMRQSSQVSRKLSAKLKKTIGELSSGIDDNKLSDEDFDKAKLASEKIRTYPIYYVDEAGTVDEVRDTILKFINEDFVKGKWVVIFLDHVLLTKGKDGESERTTVATLQKLFISLKRKYKMTIIQLSQMNRNIEDKERIMNPSLHFPNRSDLFASDSMYHASDIVMVIHRPVLLQIFEYGLDKWPTSGLVYLHIIKN